MLYISLQLEKTEHGYTLSRVDGGLLSSDGACGYNFDSVDLALDAMKAVGRILNASFFES